MEGAHALRKYQTKQPKVILFLLILIMVTSFSSCKDISSKSKDDENQKNSNQLSEKEIETLRGDFDKYCDSLAKKIIEESPLNATFMYSDLESLGLEDLLYQLDDASDEAMKKQIQNSKDILEYLDSINVRYLTEEQQKTYKMLIFQNEAFVTGEEFSYYSNAFQPSSGIQINFPISLMQIELESEKEVQAYIERVRELPRLFDQFIEYENTRAQEELLLPSYMYDLIIDQINEMIVEPESFMMYLSFCERVDMLETLSEKSKNEYKSTFLEIIKNDIYPAYDRMEVALEEIKSQSTNTLGLSEWENGQKYYDYLVGYYTSYDMDAEDLRLWTQEEFGNAIGSVQTFFTDHPDLSEEEFEAFFDKVNSLESLYEIEDEFLKDAFFDYDVTRASENIIPSYLVEHLPPAFYFPISIDGKDYGNMYVAEEAFNTITMDTLVTDIHENIPGHHLYFSVLYNSDLPLIRKVYDFDSYAEGWAQYVQDKTYEYAASDEEIVEFWRNYTKLDAALRVLMDIQVNYDGISKEEAVKQMLQMGYDQESAEAIYNRILANPGEVINYYFGSSIIEGYLLECEKALGEDFDIKAFHDLILNNAELPFDIMDDVVKDYIKEY